MSESIENKGIPDTQLIPGVNIIKRITREPSGDVIFLCARSENSEEVIVKARTGIDALSESAIERFQREYFALSTLNSPYIQKAYEFSRSTSHIALCLETATAGSLADVIKDSGNLAFSEIERILKELASALVDIHAAGIVHTNLTPQSLLFTANGTLKVSHFGQSIIQDPQISTHIGSDLGAPEYGSPEYFEHGKISGLYDIYSFGLIAYELVTGDIAFSSANPLERIERRISHEIRDPALLRSDTPVWMLDLIRDASRRNPAERIQSAQELRDRVEQRKPGNHTTHVDGRIVIKRVVSTVKGFAQKKIKPQGFSHVSSAGNGVYVHKGRKQGGQVPF